MKVLVLVSVLTIASVISDPNRVTCLLEGKFYHPESKDCHRPLELGFPRNPCEEGQWLVPTARKGIVKCVPVEDKFKVFDGSCTPFLTEKKEVSCGERLEETLFRTQNCNDGQIFLPDNFEEGTMPCPESWTCQQFNITRMGMSQQMSDNIFRDKHLRNENVKVRYVRDLICSEEKKRICLPEKERVSIFSLNHLEESIHGAQPACQKNPCSEGLWPWLGDDGYYRCYPAVKGVENCPSPPEAILMLESGVLECSKENELSLLAVSGSQRTCGRGKRLIREKCIPLWS